MKQKTILNPNYPGEGLSLIKPHPKALGKEPPKTESGPENLGDGSHTSQSGYQEQEHRKEGFTGNREGRKQRVDQKY